jgi:prepilin-type N-terminal cleavage/methylation domain-containing protein
VSAPVNGERMGTGGRRPGRTGFTLIELLIVVAVIGLLATVAILRTQTTKDRAKLTAIKADLRNFMAAEEGYYADRRRYGNAAALQAAPYRFRLSVGNAFTASAGTATSYSATIRNATIRGSTKSCRVAVGGPGGPTDGVIQCP